MKAADEQCGGDLRYTWQLGGSEPGRPLLGYGATITTRLCVGLHNAYVIVTDESGNSEVGVVAIEVVDTIPPNVVITHPEDGSSLLTKDHFAVDESVEDACDPAPSVSISYVAGAGSPVSIGPGEQVGPPLLAGAYVITATA